MNDSADRVTLPAPPTIAEVYSAINALRDEVKVGFVNQDLKRHELQRRLESIDKGLRAANDELDVIGGRIRDLGEKVDAGFQRTAELVAAALIRTDEHEKRLDRIDPLDVPNGPILPAE